MSVATEIAGRSVKQAGIVGNLGTDILGAFGNYYAAKLGSSMLHLQADHGRYMAQGYLDDAGSYMEAAGGVQESAADANRNRYLRLADDVGRVYAGAAGGNIDVGSATVRHVDRSLREQADADVAATNRTAADQANAYVAQAGASRANYWNAMASAKMMDIQAHYNKKMAKSQRRSALWSAAGNFITSSVANWAGS